MPHVHENIAVLNDFSPVHYSVVNKAHSVSSDSFPPSSPYSSSKKRRKALALEVSHCWTILITVWIFKSKSNRKNEFSAEEGIKAIFWVFFLPPPPRQSLLLLSSSSPRALSLSLNLTHRLRTPFSKQVQRNDDAQIENRCDLHDWLQCNFTLICMDLLDILAELMDC